MNLRLRQVLTQELLHIQPLVDEALTDATHLTLEEDVTPSAERRGNNSGKSFLPGVDQVLPPKAVLHPASAFVGTF